MGDEPTGVDLSGLHRELDTLKARLCTCAHQGTCLACRGFEVVRQQAQAVAAAASQPVLMQVAQEAAVRDLLGQLGGLQEKLSGDPQLSELMGRFAERLQEDLGGPEEVQRLLRGLGFPGPGFPGPGWPPGGEGPAPGGGPVPYDDRPTPPKPPDRPGDGKRPGPEDTPPGR